MYRLHYLTQSGNCFKVAFLLRALGQPYELVPVDFFGGATRTPGWRDTTNAMGEIPVLEDGSRRLSQSGAILTYLADKHGRFGGDDAEERLEILRWLLFDNHKFTSYFGTYRFMKSFAPEPPDPAVHAWLRQRVEKAYDIVDKHLRTHDFLVGGKPTIADFSLSGYVFFPVEESGLDIAAAYPAIARWRTRLTAIPGWAHPYDALPGERVAPKW